MINAEFVRQWSSHYDVKYDESHYDPYIVKARNGDKEALRKVTEWKNPRKDGSPMDFSRHQKKESSFQYFINRLPKYLGEKGENELRHDFKNRAPIWSIFWHHVLFQTPIFDRYTHMAYYWDETGIILNVSVAKIKAPNHWQIYNQYRAWFEKTLKRLKEEDNSISERQSDRSLFCWGEAEVKKQNQKNKSEICNNALQRILNSGENHAAIKNR